MILNMTKKIIKDIKLLKRNILLNKYKKIVSFEEDIQDETEDFNLLN